jgi:hypothetical protein
MVGGPPMMTSPPFVSMPFPGPPSATPPLWTPPQAAAVPPPPAWPPRQAPAVAQQPQPRPIVRLQAPEELIPPPPPPRLVLPAPEQLGVACASAAAGTPRDLPVDWNVTRDRLQSLGVVGFHLTKLSGASYRVAFVLPTTQAGRMHHIEAEAATEGAAVRRALDQADQWVGQRR